MLEKTKHLEKEKSVAKNVVFNVLYKLMNMIFPLITSVYLSHVLMATGIGKVSTAQNIAQYFVLLAPLGIANYGTREIAKIRNNRMETERLFTELFSINFCSTLGCSIVYYNMILFSNYFTGERGLYLVAGLPIIFNLINVEWFYQGHEDYVYIAIRSVLVKMASLIAIILFVKSADDYIIYALIYTLGIAGNYIFNITNLFKRGVRFNFKNLLIPRHFKPIVILLCSNIAIELYTLLDTTMLGVLCTDEVVGYYTNSIKLVKIIVALIAAIGSVLLPRLSYYKNQGMMEACNQLISNITKIMLFFAIPCGLGVTLLADKLVLVMFGETFMPAATTIRIATILIYVLGFSNLFGTQVLLTFNQEKKLLMCTCMGAISNILMNSILIPNLQHNGAVIASVISESLVTFLTIIFSRKYINISISARYWGQIIGAGFLMSIIVYVISYIISNNILCIIVSIICGGIAYFALSLILRNPIIIECKNILKRKIKG